MSWQTDNNEVSLGIDASGLEKRREFRRLTAELGCITVDYDEWFLSPTGQKIEYRTHSYRITDEEIDKDFTKWYEQLGKPVILPSIATKLKSI